MTRNGLRHRQSLRRGSSRDTGITGATDRRREWNAKRIFIRGDGEGHGGGDVLLYYALSCAL